MGARKWWVAVAALACAAADWGQAPAAPVFEVASIRAASSPAGGRGRGGGGGNRIDAARLDLPFISLADLLPYAYRVKDYQVSAPQWVRDSRWTIEAKIPAGGSADQAPEMMQALLAERFKLTVHHEKRDQPVYVLTAAPGGSKLEIAPPGDYPVWDGSFPGFSFRRGLQAGAAITGRISTGPNCSRNYEFIPLPMQAFADALTIFLARPVVDQTAMQGNYKVTLSLPAEAEAGLMANIIGGQLPSGAGGRGEGRGGAAGAPPPPPPPDAGGAGCADPITLVGDAGPPDGAIIKALQQMGLRLQAGRAAIDTIVVDRLEKTPTEN